MDKKAKSNKLLNIRVPITLFDQFRNTCKSDYKTMSEALRDLIKEYIKKNKRDNK